MATKSLAELQAENEQLRSQLRASEEARTEEQALAEATAQASAYNGNSEEQATGKTVTVSVCLNPTAKKLDDLKYKDVQAPTYYYTIEIPMGAAGSEGAFVSINGDRYYQGQTYEFTRDQLATVKDLVAKTWAHEKSIHGDNENAYRKPTHRQLGVRK